MNRVGALATLACLVALLVGPARAASSYPAIISGVHPKIVKIYGVGGIAGLEGYQSGFLISPDGHVLTAWSTVLDSDVVTVVLNSGRRYDGQLVGFDPLLEIAVLKIDATDLPHFQLDEAVQATPGTRVLAFSNLFNVATGPEAASVQHGAVAALSRLEARRGAFATRYRGPIYVLDAMTNNPGAAGGALTNSRGQLLGIVGKEVRSSLTNTWLNYAIPVSELQETVEAILAGKQPPSRAEGGERPENPLDLALLGIVLVPEVLDKTPPFIDAVRPGSPAEKSGLKVDDLIVFVDDRLVQSSRALRAEISLRERDEQVTVAVLRDGEIVPLTLSGAAGEDGSGATAE